MSQQVDEASGPLFEERWGHHWKDPERVQDYVKRTDREAEERAESFKYLVGAIPLDRALPLRVLDIGSGHGVIAAALLDQFPSSSAVGLDISEPMMEVGRERMAQYGARFHYHVGDFADGELPADLVGPFDIVVSSRAIHHLPSENKGRLYQEIFGLLAPEGCFFNLDIVGPRDDYLKEIYRQAGEFVSGQPAQRPMPSANRTSAHGHFPDRVADHLRLLSEAGFDPVDCFWKKLGDALVGGYKRT